MQLSLVTHVPNLPGDTSQLSPNFLHTEIGAGDDLWSPQAISIMSIVNRAIIGGRTIAQSGSPCVMCLRVYGDAEGFDRALARAA